MNRLKTLALMSALLFASSWGSYAAEEAPKFKESQRGLAAMSIEAQHREEMAEMKRKLETIKLQGEIAKAEKEKEKAEHGDQADANPIKNAGNLSGLGSAPVIAPLGDSTRLNGPQLGGKTGPAAGAPLPPPLPLPDLTPNPKITLAGVADGYAVFVLGGKNLAKAAKGDVVAGYKVEKIDDTEVILVKVDGDPALRSRLTFNVGL